MLAKLEGKPSPRPAKDALAKAEAKVRQTFKDDLASAAKPKAKAALAEKLLKAAERADNDDAARLALLTVARDLAIQAGDAHAAMKAVRAIVRHFEPDGLTDAKAQFERANALWKEAEAARAGKRLPLQLEAQELYLRAWPEAIEADELLLIGERLALLEKLAGGMPSGWVKLINRTAGFEFPNAYLDSHLSGSLFHFEPAGEYYTIREKQSGRYLVVRETRGGIRPVWRRPTTTSSIIPGTGATPKTPAKPRHDGKSVARPTDSGPSPIRRAAIACGWPPASALRSSPRRRKTPRSNSGGWNQRPNERLHGICRLARQPSLTPVTPIALSKCLYSRSSNSSAVGSRISSYATTSASRTTCSRGRSQQSFPPPKCARRP